MDFPDLVLSRIFFYLNLDITDKFRLRLVCKRWKELIDWQISAKRSLCVYDESYCYFNELKCYPYKDRWPSNGQLISHSDVLTQTLFENLVGHFWRIQRLALHRTRKETFGNQEVLPKLLELLSSRLVELSLFVTGLLEEDGPVRLERLSFPVLKTLRILEQFSEPLQIVAPELEKLIIEHWASIRTITFERNPPIVLSHPEKLKHLECQMVDQLTGKYFPSLKHLTVRHMNQPRFDLSDYRKLKRLDLWIPYCLYQPEEVFENFLQQKQNLRMDELTITHFGFKKCFDVIGIYKWGLCPLLTNVHFLGRRTSNIIDNLSEFIDDSLDQRFGTWSDLDLLSHLESLVGFYCKANLVQLRLESLSSEQSDQLIRFLRAIQGLEKLRLKKCKFAKEFYKQLKSVPFIAQMVVEECSEIETCDFIEHINGLIEFELHQNVLPFDFFDVFRRSKLKSLKFRTSNLSFELRRKGTSYLKERKFESTVDLYRFLQNKHQDLFC